MKNVSEYMGTEQVFVPLRGEIAELEWGVRTLSWGLIRGNTCHFRRHFWSFILDELGMCRNRNSQLFEKVPHRKSSAILRGFYSEGRKKNA